MSVAREEIALLRHYDYAVVNDEIDAACHRIQSIVVAEHCRRERFETMLEQLEPASEKV